MRLFSRIAAAAAAAITLHAGLASAQDDEVTVTNRILVLARTAYEASVITTGLDGYAIPFQTVLVPQAGIQLPALNASGEGNYGGIIILGEASYEYATGFASALTTAQWQALYNYQTAFAVRMVRLDVYPGPQFGAATAIDGGGCCNAGVEQLVSVTDASAFPTANIKVNQGVSTLGLWHYPAVIANATIAKPIAKFAPAGDFKAETVAAVINNIDGREQQAWFISWATDWSQTSNFLQHAYIHWITRGLFVGKRRVYLNTQVDDMHLATELYIPEGESFRIRTSDLDAHMNWQSDLNTRLPPGSDYYIEIGHNGNGGIEAAVVTDPDEETCDPPYAVWYDSPPDTDLEFRKPLGSGTDLWPDEFSSYDWTDDCAHLDDVTRWFSTHRDVFASVSHTFSHEELNNATYDDAAREIDFNVAWLQQIGLWDSEWMSPNGLIPPAITGLHNGDAIRAWMDHGVKYVVGDNTRPKLRNTQNSFWPLMTNRANNGYPGLVIIPRWATTIYYNCDTAECTLQEWIDTSGGYGSFPDLLNDARSVNTRYLLGLRPDPYMFHQANMREGDTDWIRAGAISGRLSLLQTWVETIVAEMMRLTNWPIRSLRQDDIAQLFMERQTRDNCHPNLKWNYSADRKSIISATVTADNNRCSVLIPVTFPGPATTKAPGNLEDKVGTEPLVWWTKLDGVPVTYTLTTPLKL